MDTPAPVKRKRNRDTLTPTEHEKRSIATSRKDGDCFLRGSRARNYDSKEIFQSKQKNGRISADAYWSQFEEMDTADESFEPENSFNQMGAGVAAIRRKAIEFVFVHVYQLPPEKDWATLKLVPNVCKILQINSNSKTAVRNVLLSILTAYSDGVAYDEKANLQSRGRKALIDEYDECAKIVYHAMCSGQSIQSAIVMVNRFRLSLEPPLPAISWSAVQSFVFKSSIIETHRR